ncbi:MAG: adenylate kinase [Spirochaetes bacterium GWD1_27_9]|nr:MAG: adenylate kinase [Spirochaetes bacterium GWB1_27_13]OHD25532.1 MAG: adenylate kinase [Spirochaetes bacterium GWC1_27_15]OHD41510.1 MAG: adenylate kinase [Spirochaetes bacterium GWD1_27_9]
MKLVFFGAPGAGKGTIAKKFNEEFGIPQISTGDLFRAAIKNKTELGLKVSEIMAKGGLVSDDITIGIVKERIKNDDCKDGYILDGFPRTMIQAENWEKADSVDLAIYFDIKDDEVKKRLGGRRVCPKCGKIYNVFFSKPKVENICDNDNETLIIREDDREEAIANRLVVYHSQTAPLLDYYKKFDKVIAIDATAAPEMVYSQIKKALKF